MKKTEYIQPQVEVIDLTRFCEGESVGEPTHPSRDPDSGLTDFDANTGTFDEDDNGFTPVASSLWD